MLRLHPRLLLLALTAPLLLSACQERIVSSRGVLTDRQLPRDLRDVPREYRPVVEPANTPRVKPPKSSKAAKSAAAEKPVGDASKRPAVSTPK